MKFITKTTNVDVDTGEVLSSLKVKYYEHLKNEINYTKKNDYETIKNITKLYRKSKQQQIKFDF